MMKKLTIILTFAFLSAAAYASVSTPNPNNVHGPLNSGGGSIIIMPKSAAAPSVAPGAGFCQIFAVAGTNPGTGKLQAQCGTSTTAVTILDNIGSGF